MNENQTARINRLVAEAETYGVDWVLCTLPENIFYFSGFRTSFYTRFMGVLVPVNKDLEPVLIGFFIDRGLIESGLWSKTWFEKTVIWGPGGDYPDPWSALNDFLEPGMRLGVDSIQLDFYRQLREVFPGLEVVGLTDSILKVRTVKDQEELSRIRAAFALSEEVMSQVPEMLSRPVTEKELAAELNYRALKAGAEDIFYPTLVSCGEKMLALHAPPLDRPIKEGELIRIAFGLQLEGYGSDIVRHFCLGGMPTQLEPLRKAYFEVLEIILGEIIRPGLDTRDLVEQVERMYTERGVVGHWLGSVGHGLALTIHEFPRIAPTESTILKENMVLAVEPLLALAPYGAITHCEGLVVTADGCERLSGRIRDVVVL